MNDEFVKYVGTLKPNETVLQLYEQILADIRDEGNKDKKNEIVRLKKELSEQEKLVESVEDKYFSNEIDSNVYQKMLKRYNGVIESLKSKIEMLAGTITNIEPKLKYSISLINNIDTFISDAPVEVKIKLISSMFPEKIEFDGIRYRTNSYNKVLDLIYQETKELRTGQIKNGVSFDTHPARVPRAGVEPARVAPLVFETSASTDSAIWATFALQR